MPDDGERFVPVRWLGRYAVLDREEGKVASWGSDKDGRDTAVYWLRTGRVFTDRYNWAASHPARGELRRDRV